MGFKKDLESLDTKEEKIIFIRKIILDKKENKQNIEEAIKILNQLLKSDSLEDKLDSNNVGIDNLGNFSLQKQDNSRKKLKLEEMNILDSYTKAPKDIQNKKVQDNLQDNIIYDTDQTKTLDNLRYFLDQKDLLSNPSIDKQEISKQINQYFGRNLSSSEFEKYFSIFTKDSVEYQNFGNDKEMEINISGRKIRYYKRIKSNAKK